MDSPRRRMASGGMSMVTKSNMRSVKIPASSPGSKASLVLSNA